MVYDERLNEEELLHFIDELRRKNEKLRDDEARAVGRLEAEFRSKRGRMEELFKMRVQLEEELQVVLLEKEDLLKELEERKRVNVRDRKDMEKMQEELKMLRANEETHQLDLELWKFKYMN